jgi:hypothetical protein
MSDLLVASDKFRAEGRDFTGAMPASGPAPVNGGSWVVNDALSQVLESIGLLHTQFAGVIANDAGNLDATYREYQWAEDQITTVVRGIVVDPGAVERATGDPGADSGADPGADESGKAR